MTQSSTTPRKPRIALMGEFSAGKSTLSNLLLGAKPLPEKVTATRLSPVWISHGTDAPYRIDVDGSEEPVSLENLEELPVEETRAIRLFFQAEILELCDLIDFPGISDPNMDSEVWERMLTEVDAVFWCTHATQAWRQSEAAVWDTIPQAVKDRSTLLITRFDKITNESDRERVLARVNMETEGQFKGVFPISLTQALAASNNAELWESCGAADFFGHMIDQIIALGKEVAESPEALIAPMAATSKPDEATTGEPDASVEGNISDLLSSFDTQEVESTPVVEPEVAMPAAAIAEIDPQEEPATAADILPNFASSVENSVRHALSDEKPEADLVTEPETSEESPLVLKTNVEQLFDEGTAPADPVEPEAPEAPEDANTEALKGAVIPRRILVKKRGERDRPRRPGKTVSGDELLETLETSSESEKISKPLAPIELKSVFSDHD
ncbi:MAG: dynamin family protein [Litoreibacter sp.]